MIFRKDVSKQKKQMHEVICEFENRILSCDSFHPGIRYKEVPKPLLDLFEKKFAKALSGVPWNKRRFTSKIIEVLENREFHQAHLLVENLETWPPRYWASPFFKKND